MAPGKSCSRLWFGPRTNIGATIILMKLVEHFLHLFTPRHTNNHRAKILHTSGVIFCIAFLLVFQLGLTLVHKVSPEVLGYASNISIPDLLNETNSQRTTAGIPTLSLNDQLANAAAGKASDMFTNQYWAHISPQGQEPWAFITGAGYNYVFAGENLARDFGDSKSVVDAWINSASHKENLLNPRFQDVGFAIVNGKYGDSETTLVVQMFGARSGEQAIAAAVVNTPSPTPSPAPTAIQSATPAAAPIAVVSPPPAAVLPAISPISQPKYDILGLTKNLALGLTLVLLGVLAVDTILVYQRKTVRISGHNFAHALMLIMVLAAISLIGRGIII